MCKRRRVFAIMQGVCRAWAGEKKLDKQFRIRQAICCQSWSKLNSDLLLSLIAAPKPIIQLRSNASVNRKQVFVLAITRHVAIQPTADIRNYVLSNDNFRASETSLNANATYKNPKIYTGIFPNYQNGLIRKIPYSLSIRIYIQQKSL